MNNETKIDFDWADYLQRFSTKVLWHFTGYQKENKLALEILKQIIHQRTLKLSERKTEIIMPSGQKRYGYACSCMCDIPFKDLRIHVSRYGAYGIAFNKENAINFGGFNPVLYIQKNHSVLKHIEDELLPFIDHISKLLKDSSNKINKIEEYLNIIGSYIKRSDLTAPISIGNPVIDKNQDNNFYYEREWRSIFDWKFSAENIEGIMVLKQDLNEIRKFMESEKIETVPVIPYEMVLRF